MHSLLLLALGFGAYLPVSCHPGIPSVSDLSQLEKRQSPGFTYTGASGPLNWDGLSPNFAICRTGKRQSPINIDNGISAGARVTDVSYPNLRSAPLVNTGKTIECPAKEFSPRGSLTFEGQEYLLENFHIHVPSEHRIFEEFYGFEIHFVHSLKSDPTKLLVVGVMAELSKNGQTYPLLFSIFDNLEDIKQPNQRTETGALNFDPFETFVKNTPMYRYQGSLTTPPCAETVTWLVASKPVDISVELFNLIKSIVKFNSRYTQNTPGQTNLLEL